jgi:DNA-binding transcriptional MerR regulator
MLTIGQLTRHTGVPARTIRFYHAKGVLPEPARDQSGYRRYTAHDAATLIKIRTMGAAGVPLADIQRLLAATPEQLQLAVSDIEHRLDQRIQELQNTRIRLRELATGFTGILPTGVPEYLNTLRNIGLSDRWIAMESELWILLFATHPDIAEQLLADQHQAKTHKEVQAIYRTYDDARDLDPSDPRLRNLADRIADATQSRYPSGELPIPDQHDPIADLIQEFVNNASPAWRTLDRLIRAKLRLAAHTPKA